MQQTIEFRADAQERKQLDVRATIQRKINSINLWLDAKSELYSRIAEFSVTRRMVLRVNLISLCVIITSMAVAEQPLVALVSTLSTGYLVYRLNKNER